MCNDNLHGLLLWKETSPLQDSASILKPFKCIKTNSDVLVGIVINAFWSQISMVCSSQTELHKETFSHEVENSYECIL